MFAQIAHKVFYPVASPGAGCASGRLIEHILFSVFSLHILSAYYLYSALGKMGGEVKA